MYASKILLKCLTEATTTHYIYATFNMLISISNKGTTHTINLMSHKWQTSLKNIQQIMENTFMSGLYGALIWTCGTSTHHVFPV